jgi:hypothetical protein
MKITTNPNKITHLRRSSRSSITSFSRKRKSQKIQFLKLDKVSMKSTPHEAYYCMMKNRQDQHQAIPLKPLTPNSNSDNSKSSRSYTADRQKIERIKKMNKPEIPVKDQSNEQKIKKFKFERAQRMNGYITTTSDGKLLIGKVEKIKNTPADIVANVAFKCKNSRPKKKNYRCKLDYINLYLI